jgi:adenosylcobinamide-phosphate synthase
VVAAATWAVLGARSLADEATALHALLARGDLPAARQQLTHLAGRDPSALDAAQIARAGVESLAENSSDAVVAPLVWGALFGVPGLVGYRAVNTLDAMVGHHTPRYENFGWASARLDDAANLVPARVTAALVALVSGRPRAVWQVVRRDARAHPSPNAGWCEAAFAAALGLRLGGRNVYAGRVEERPQLGTGRPAAASDLPRAARLMRRVGAAATLLAAAVAVLRQRGGMLTVPQRGQLRVR